MKKLSGFNSPRGMADNAAQKQRPANVTPITKHILPPVAVPLKTVSDKFNHKGNEA
jgi:hypothetical protein